MSEDQLKWTCQVDDQTLPPPEVKNPNGDVIQGMTVGHPFYLDCDGPTGTLRTELLKFKQDKKQANTLMLLEVKQMAETRSQLMVTSYVPGQHRLKDVVLTDGLAEERTRASNERG